jgi:Tol biopolymer transport system component
VADDGSVAERLTIPVGDGLPPACAVWSPDGDRVAFGVALTSAINPDRSGEGSEVWVVRLSDGAITRIEGLLAVDLDWSPDGTTLAILGGVATDSGEDVIDGLQDARIHLHDVAAGTLRRLDDTLGAGELAWSPEGRRIAYTAPDLKLRVFDVETGREDILTAPYASIHGIGAVWSPGGETIAYQRCPGSCSGERTAVVLLTPDDRSAQTGLANEVELPMERTTVDGLSLELFPWRVIWSPDGTYLLYVAWTYDYEGAAEQTLVVAVPRDVEAPAVVLADGDGIGASDFSGGAMHVPIQVWQRRPAAP